MSFFSAFQSSNDQSREPTIPQPLSREYLLSQYRTGSYEEFPSFMQKVGNLTVETSQLPLAMCPMTEAEERELSSDRWALVNRRPKPVRPRHQHQPRNGGRPFQPGPADYQQQQQSHWRSSQQDTSLQQQSTWSSAFHSVSRHNPHHQQHAPQPHPHHNYHHHQQQQHYQQQPSVRPPPGVLSQGHGMQWWYKDFQQELHGPFSAEDMQAWYKLDYLPLQLLVRSHPNAPFVPLGTLFQSGDKAFLDQLPSQFTTSTATTEPEKDEETCIQELTAQTQELGISPAVPEPTQQQTEQEQPVEQTTRKEPVVEKVLEEPETPSETAQVVWGKKQSVPTSSSGGAWDKVSSSKPKAKAKPSKSLQRDSSAQPEQETAFYSDTNSSPQPSQEEVPVPTKPSTMAEWMPADSIKPAASAWKVPEVRPGVSLKNIIDEEVSVEESAETAEENSSRPGSSGQQWSASTRSSGGPGKSLMDIMRQEEEEQRRFEETHGKKTQTMASRIASGWGQQQTAPSLASIMRQQESVVHTESPQTSGGWARAASSQKGSAWAISSITATASTSTSSNHNAQPLDAQAEADDGFFWDEEPVKAESPKAKDVPEQQEQLKNPPTPKKGSGAFGGPGMSKEFQAWCKKALRELTGSEDMTLAEFLVTLDSAESVRDYVFQYLGKSAKSEKFADGFLRQKEFESGKVVIPLKNGSRSDEVQEESAPAKTSKRKKKKKTQIILDDSPMFG